MIFMLLIHNYYYAGVQSSLWLLLLVSSMKWVINTSLYNTRIASSTAIIIVLLIIIIFLSNYRCGSPSIPTSSSLTWLSMLPHSASIYYTGGHRGKRRRWKRINCDQIYWTNNLYNYMLLLIFPSEVLYIIINLSDSWGEGLASII